MVHGVPAIPDIPLPSGKGALQYKMGDCRYLLTPDSTLRQSYIVVLPGKRPFLFFFVQFKETPSGNVDRYIPHFPKLGTSLLQTQLLI